MGIFKLLILPEARVCTHVLDSKFSKLIGVVFARET